MRFFCLYLILQFYSLNNIWGQSCPNPIKIVVLGASTSYGLGASVPDSAYVNRYREFLIDSVNDSSVVINLAWPGYTTYEMQPTGFVPPPDRINFPVDTARNITKAISLQPDGIIINFPSNDANGLFTLEETRDNFLRATHLADSAGILCWVTTTQPRNFAGNPDSIKAAKKLLLLEMRDTIIAYYPQNYIEFYEGFADSVGDILLQYDSGDHIHVNDAGHKILFERVKNTGMDSILCSISLSASSYSGVNDDLMLFPNPVSNELSVKTNNSELSQIILYDFTSRILLQQKFINSVFLNTSQLTNGIYIYQVSNKNGTIKSGKVLKE